MYIIMLEHEQILKTQSKCRWFSLVVDLKLFFDEIGGAVAPTGNLLKSEKTTEFYKQREGEGGIRKQRRQRK